MKFGRILEDISYSYNLIYVFSLYLFIRSVRERERESTLLANVILSDDM